MTLHCATNVLILKPLHFCPQINRHYSLFATPDMTLERLHKIATSNVQPHFKTKYLQWWNSSDTVRKSVRFPLDRPMKDKVLETWLHYASLWSQVRNYN